LGATLDLPPQFGGVGLQSFIRVAYKELMGSWALFIANLISFLRSKGLSVYDRLAYALDGMQRRIATPETPTSGKVWR
jgi:hypothetical protein